MPTFHYQALNAQRESIAGDIVAHNVAQAVTQLEAQGLTLQSIVLVAAVSGEQIVEARIAPNAPSPEQRALQSHLASLIERAKPITPGLAALAEEFPPGSRRQQLLTVVGAINRGDIPALESLPDYWIPLLSSAATARDPGHLLRGYLRESQSIEQLRWQRWQTRAYPSVVIGLCVAIFVFMSYVPIPVFREMFVDFRLELPVPTAFVLSVASLITSGRILWIALAIAAAIVMTLVIWRFLPTEFREWWDDRFGNWLGRNTALARLTRYIAELLEAGLDVPNALRIAGYSVRNTRLQRAAWRTAQELEYPQRPFGDFGPSVLSHSVLYAIRAALPSRTRVRLLRELSLCYAERAQSRVSWTRGMLGPLAVCAVGLTVGFTVVSLFLPLVSLIQGLSGGGW